MIQCPRCKGSKPLVRRTFSTKNGKTQELTCPDCNNRFVVVSTVFGNCMSAFKAAKAMERGEIIPARLQGE